MAKPYKIPDFRKLYPEASEEVIAVLRTTERKQYGSERKANGGTDHGYGSNRIRLFVSCSRRAAQRVFDFNHTGKSRKFCRRPFHGCPADDSNGYAGSADSGYGRWIFESVSEENLCREILKSLAPIQMGEAEQGEILVVDRDTADEYFMEEDQAVTMAELSMQ